MLAPAATPAPIIARLAEACAGAARDAQYATTARNAAQPDDYYGDAAVFKARLQRDIERKTAVLARVTAQT